MSSGDSPGINASSTVPSSLSTSRRSMEYEARGRTGKALTPFHREDRGPAYPAAPEALQRLVGLLQREQLHFGLHQHLRRESQELLPVAPGEVRHRLQSQRYQLARRSEDDSGVESF